MKTEILNFHVHAEPIEEIAEKDRSGIDVEHFPDAVGGIVVEHLVDPCQRMRIWLADAAEVARDGVGAAQVDV
jgi:hypothetical protein